MTRMARRIVVAVLMLVVIGAIAAPAEAASRRRTNAPASTPRAWLGDPGHRLHRGPNGAVNVDVCSQSVGPGVAQCYARARTDLFDDDVRPDPPRATPTDTAGTHAGIGNQGAYDPAYLQSAYNAPSHAGAGQTVATVVAFDAPDLERDLAHYRAYFGLSPCTTANGCFRKVDQNGGANYPPYDASWAAEATLDVQMVSAVCPNCHILVVEARTAQFTNLGAAVNTAVALGADVVSNSYGAEEFADETGYNDAYDHPGVAVVASSGDSGYGVSYPASAPDVVAVGGTSLVQTGNGGTRDATETVWSGAGSGCSEYETKRVWQTDTGCATRSVADVAAVADPATGVWVYNSADGGWEVFGGTSVSAPIIGAFYALAGDARATDDVVTYPYAHRTALNDVTSGSNGSCGGTYLCAGRAGYDGPSGLGTPNTAAAFSSAGVTPPPPPPPNGPTPDFTIGVSRPSGGLTPGATARRTVKLTPTHGFTGPVRLSVSVRPEAGLTTHLRRAPVAIGNGPFTTPLTFRASKGGTYSVTVRAARGARVHRRTITVSVKDFTMRVSRTQARVVRGAAVRFRLSLRAVGALEGSVRLSTGGLSPSDEVSYTRNPVPATKSVVVTVRTSVNDAKGTRTVRFSGTAGSLRHTVSVRLTFA
jgi:hypothetical protein